MWSRLYQIVRRSITLDKGRFSVVQYKILSACDLHPNRCLATSVATSHFGKWFSIHAVFGMIDGFHDDHFQFP